MLVKSIIFFLAVIAVIGWVGTWLGRLRLPGRKAAFCAACGRPRVGDQGCPCGAP